MSKVKISVAICTHNRAEDLAACVAALKPQMAPECEYIIVDSGSAPDQRQAIARTIADAPGFRLIRLDEPGLSLARNVALAEAKGEWLALIDDDAVPAPNWTETALALFARAPAKCAILGGAVHPLVPAGAERPLGPRWRQLLATVETEGEFAQTDAPLVVGANMWFRCAPTRQAGGFPANLGRIGKSLLSGEDKLVVNRLIAQGWRIYYSDKLEVGHKIHRERLTRKWASTRAYWDGVSDRRIHRALNQPQGIARILRIGLNTIGLAVLYPLPSPRQEFFLRFWYNVGWLREQILPLPLSAGA